jgi:hypothetical protein
LWATLSARGFAQARDQAFSGPLAGAMVFTAEERTGLGLIRSLDDQQAKRAILQPSIHPDDLRPGLQEPANSQMSAWKRCRAKSLSLGPDRRRASG